MNETVTLNNDRPLSTAKNCDIKNGQYVSATDEPLSGVTAGKDKNIESEPISLLSSNECNNVSDDDVNKTTGTTLNQTNKNDTIPCESLEQAGGLLGVTSARNIVTPVYNLNSTIGDTMSEEPMDVDLTSEQNARLDGITVTRNGVTNSLHGVSNLNSLDHSYSRQCMCIQIRASPVKCAECSSAS